MLKTILIPGYKQLLDEKIQQSSKLVMDAKERYFSEQGKKLFDPSLGPKKYWSILNNFLQKKNIPIIRPLWENGIFVSDCADKAELFNNFFASQSTPLDTGSVLPQFQLKTRHTLTDILVDDANPSLDTKGIFLEMSKAFGKVWHEGLIYKLRSYGVQSTLIDPLKDYLSNKKQRVIINGASSSWRPIKSSFISCIYQ